MQKKSDKPNRRSAYHPKPPFSCVEGVGTPPFERLDPYAQWVLLKFYSKFTGKNRSNLELTYREVKGIMANAIYSRSVWQLVGFGFIDVLRWGRLQRNCTLFGLSNRWRRLCEGNVQARLERIKGILEEIENLKRKKDPNRSAKRQRIAALRHSIFG